MAGYSREEIEVKLQHLSLKVTGLTRMPTESRHAMTLELVWPRNGIPSRSYTRVVTLKKGECAFADSDWMDAILAKEQVLGRAGLKVTISQPLADKVVTKLLAALAEAAVNSIADGVSTAFVKPLGKTLATPIDYVASLLTGESVLPVAEATCLLEPDFIKTGGGVVTLPLTAPCTLTKVQNSTTKIRRPPKKVIAKGDSNGTITLAIELM